MLLQGLTLGENGDLEVCDMRVTTYLTCVSISNYIFPCVLIPSGGNSNNLWNFYLYHGRKFL